MFITYSKVLETSIEFCLGEEERRTKLAFRRAAIFVEAKLSIVLTRLLADGAKDRKHFNREKKTTFSEVLFIWEFSIGMN